MTPWILLLSASLLFAEPVPEPTSWSPEGREKALETFRHEVYGTTPTDEIPRSWKLDRESSLKDGRVRRREYLLTLGQPAEALTARVLIYLPAEKENAPAFLGLNFGGNHTLENDEWITKTNERSRGTSEGRWPIEMITDAGFALITVHCDDFDPDEDDGFQNGVHALFPEPRNEASWGTIAGWAWGLRQVREQLEILPEINAKKVTVLGHSRLGKAALWAGANDENFAMVISNNSGCGGAALSKRKHGETVGRINQSFPHWFADNFKKYADKEETLPVDQHQLIACIAPRPVYVASASKDNWADPEGEFLALKMAAPAWNESLSEMPIAGETVTEGKISYHLRDGKHNITSWDWERYIAAAQKHL